MRVFTCDRCGQTVFFENSACLRCGAELGYRYEQRDVVALEPAPVGLVEVRTGTPRDRCATWGLTGCTWLVDAGSGAVCASCALTRTRPADDDPAGLAEWVTGEVAKRRLLFQLAELDLPVTPRDERNGRGLAFDLLSSTATRIITGHDNGVVTLDLAEADPEHRARLRQELGEPYRTVLGHFRHEIGHYYWPILVTGARLEEFRSRFGDERTDYGSALSAHYATLGPLGALHGPLPGPSTPAWSDAFISRYASMHPFEDWAETFAHYLHILDTLQTADSFGLGLTHTSGLRRFHRTGARATRPDGATDFDTVVTSWLELTTALNQINRSMGHDDLYPFVLAPAVVDKLRFVDSLVHG